MRRGGTGVSEQEYEIPITRKESVTKTFTVKAESEEAAREQAMQMAEDYNWPRAGDADYHFE